MIWKKFNMDIILSKIDNEPITRLMPVSAYGILWLQTHFDDDKWDDIASYDTVISLSDSKSLIKDANEAGVHTVSIT
tara:strand:- start:120 stop:350 length:231 start_codon:yes stop_codon:yes gene_type:complete